MSPTEPLLFCTLNINVSPKGTIVSYLPPPLPPACDAGLLPLPDNELARCVPASVMVGWIYILLCANIVDNIFLLNGVISVPIAENVLSVQEDKYVFPLVA